MASTKAQPKETVRELIGALGDGDEERLSELFSDDIVEHFPYSEVHGIEEVIESHGLLTERFPDQSREIESIIAENNMVAVHYTIEGEYHGDDIKEGTRKRIDRSLMAMMRVENGEVTEVWGEWNQLSHLHSMHMM